MPLSVLAGCAPNLVTVEGTVTCDGVPLAYTTVRFVPDAGTLGNGAVAETDEAGRYFLSSINPSDSTAESGCFPGRYHVAVYEVPRWPPPSGPRTEIPEVYTSKESTPLVLDVLESGGVVNLELTSIELQTPNLQR